MPLMKGSVMEEYSKEGTQYLKSIGLGSEKRELVRKLKSLNIEVQQVIDELFNFNVEVVIEEKFLNYTIYEGHIDKRTVKFIAREVL